MHAAEREVRLSLKKLVVLLVVSILGGSASAERFDIVTYQPPAGWASAVDKSGALTLSSSAKSQFAAIIVLPSTPSAGSLDKDFQAAWKAAIVPQFGVTAKPRVTPAGTKDGWQRTTGLAAGKLQNVDVGVVLFTATGNGRTVHVIVATSSATYGDAVAKFLDGIAFDTPTTPTAPTTPAAPPTSETTTFPDGWTAVRAADFVEVTRGKTRVRLHYGVALDVHSRPDQLAFFWKRFVEPRYKITSKVAMIRNTDGTVPVYFASADAAEGFVALRVIPINGTAHAIEVLAPSRAAFEKDFPDQDKLAAIRGANRFALGKLAGTWSSSSSSFVELAYVATGGYAGIDSAQLADTFVFDGSKSYKSEHKGATGRVGTQKTFQVNHAGTYQVAPWELTLVNEEGTSKYSAQYEAVRNGLVLHLQNLKFAGMKYALVRTR